MSTDKISVWESSWSGGDTSWHLQETNDRLLANMNELTGCAEHGDNVKKSIFVPLCGKTKDMIYLHGLGHTVAGCEWVESACIQFFTENSIAYTRTPLENVEGFLYQVRIEQNQGRVGEEF